MHQTKRKSIIVFIAVLAFNLVITGNTAAVAITVNNSTGLDADFTSIQAAVNAATPGDEIIVKPGIYEENIEITRALTIHSESGNSSDTIIQAADSSKDVFGIWANEVGIKGFTIRGSDSAAGIHFFGVADCRIEHNILSNNSFGIDLYMFSSGNILVDNDVSDSLTGISFGGSLNNTLRNNSISYCSSGISLFDSPYNTLENNTVSENNEGISLTGESNDNILISNTIKSNKKVGLHIYETSGNLIYNNYFNNTENVESELVAGENIWNTTKSEGTNIVGGSYLGGNFWGRPDGTVYPVGARDTDLDGIFDSMYDIEDRGFIDYLPLKESKSTVITVSNSADQAADFTSIQAAVYSAYPGDTILVYPSVYVENVEINVEDLVLVSASGSPSDTRVQAARSSEDVFSVTADGVVISGFNVTGNISYLNSGIHLYGVEDCLIENNELFYYQGTLQNSSGNYTQGKNYNLNPGFGIRLDLSGNNTLSNNTISYSNACILLRSSNENILLDNRVSNSSYGIWLDSSSNGNTLDENRASYNRVGIYLKASNENVLASNTASDSSYGFWLDSSSNGNTLGDSRVPNNRIGIYLKASGKNILAGNSVSLNSKYGIYMNSSSNNTFNSNTVDSNSGYGICILSSNSNTVYNNYLNNTKNVYLDGKSSGNIWNVSKNSGTNIVGNSFPGGNFWASPKGNGFSQTHPDADGDGICEIIYDLGKGNIDYLPLAGSF